MHTLSLLVMPQKLAVCQMEHDAQIPQWAINDSFFSISKSDDELSVVCSEDLVPHHIRAERGWRSIKVQGPLDFSLTGILASLAAPLAQANISIFAISTFDTDYILVKEGNLEKAIQVLSMFCNIQR